MFESIRNNKRVAQVILGVLIVPFAAFGLNSYFGDGLGSREIATVGGSPISQGEFDHALREEQDRLREQLGGNATTALLDSEELRQRVLDQLVIRRALELYSRDMRLTVSSRQLQQVIAGIDGFQENGQFSSDRYHILLAQRRMTPAVFEAQLAQDLLSQQLEISIGGLPMVARHSARRLLVAQREKRLVREMRFPVAPYLTKIEIDDAAIQKFYDESSSLFDLPERVKAEYLVLSEEALQDTIEIDEADIQKAYQSWPKERHVRHILIGFDPDADAAAQEAARKQAEEIVAILRKEPDRFPELAREKSQDPGSSGAGGDLGKVMHDGTMEPSFEDAAFALKQGEISDPVRTRYGFHILQVTAIRSFDEVRDEIVARLRKQALGQIFYEKGKKLSEITFDEVSDSLEPAAKAFGLEIRRTDWIDRGTDTLGEFRTAELVARLFEDDALVQRNNTPVIDVGFDTKVVARVIEHEARKRLPLEEVRGQIEAQLRREEAMRMAREEGKAALAAFDQGEAVDNGWSEPHYFQRSTRDFPDIAVRAVFAASLESMPARVAVELPDDAYMIYQIDSVERPSISDDDKDIDALAGQYGILLAQSDLESFLASLRDRYKVVIRPRLNQAPE